jgi:hypothetical protein
MYPALFLLRRKVHGYNCLRVRPEKFPDETLCRFDSREDITPPLFVDLDINDDTAIHGVSSSSVM